MKIFKKLSALMAAVVIFGSTAMAADFKFDDKIEYTTGDTSVTVSFYAGENVNSIGQDASVIITYDTSVYTIDKATALTSTVDGGWLSTLSGQAIWGMNGTYEITDKTTPLFTLKFDVIDGKNPVGTVFGTHADSWMYSIQEDDFDTSGMSITVTSATPVDPDPEPEPDPEPDPEPQPGDLGEKDGYVTVVDDAGDTRFVLTDTKTSVSATAATVLKATYAGTTKQANLANLLGATIEDGANITIGKITIKMVLPASVTDSADIADYSFEIK